MLYKRKQKEKSLKTQVPLSRPNCQSALFATLASRKSVADLFYDHKILVNTNVNKDVFSGIQKVKSYLKNSLGQTKLFIFNTCENMIREIKAYRCAPS